MSRGKGESAAGPVRMIDRPRLRAILDQSTANVVLVVGPAGYGKTTLARQWVALSNPTATWYQCTEASTDVAALALGIARASQTGFGDGPDLVQSRLRSGTPDSADPAALVELLAARLESGGEAMKRWIVLDDYHHLIRSGPAEQFVAELVATGAIRLAICTRRRPSWASARRLVYGEIEEISRSTLAMTEREIAEVLGRDHSTLSGFFDRTEGWPAVIGLAARSRDRTLSETRGLPPELYEFIADELYQSLPEQLSRDLHRLVILPTGAYHNLEQFFGERTPKVVEELTNAGFLTANDRSEATREASFDLHPLLRGFVEEKMASALRAPIREEASAIARILLDASSWDEAFNVISRFLIEAELPHLIEKGLRDVLSEGRTSTLEEWLNAAERMNVGSPVIDVARSELLLRRGAWMQAIRLASRAADALGDDHELTCRALNCAARAAHFSDRSDLATALHERALAVARGAGDIRESLWGKFISESAIDLVSNARATLDEYDELEVCDEDDLLRRMTGRLVLAARHGPLQSTIDVAPSYLSTLRSASDPLTRTGFLQMFTCVMALGGRYAEARESAVLEIDEARRYRLDAIEAHALCALAMAEIGLRRPTAAASALDHAEQKLRGVDDVHAQMNISTLRMRIAMIRRDYAAALLEAERTWSRVPNAGIQGDLLATRGLVHVCVGDVTVARELAVAAERTTAHIETRVTALSVSAAALIREQDPSAIDAAGKALAFAYQSGAYDPFVVAYRSFPELLDCAASTSLRPRLLWVIDLAGDDALARQRGILVASDRPTLSPREQEVLELLAKGLSNRQIAQSLWISESTAKVHVRHIFDKLAVRTRTEAAIKAREIENSGTGQTATTTNSGDASR